MPSTVNGIGTHYYGAKNEVRFRAPCERCGRADLLQRSYDTREWVCVLYVPLIPLRRFRILSECPACTVHRRVPLDEFQRVLSSELDPLAERARSGDPEAALEHARALVAFQQFAPAREVLERLAAARPDDARVRLALGSLLERTDQAARAVPHFEEAVRLLATTPEERTGALEALAYALVAAGDAARAIERFEELLAIEPGHAPWTYQLARALARVGRHADAARAFNELIAREPAAARDASVAREAAAAHAAAGLPLPAAVRPVVRANRAFLAAIAIMVVGTLAAVGIGAAWFARTVAVVVDNPSDRPLAVKLDGKEWLSLGPHEHSGRIRIAAGEHELEAREGDALEKFPIAAAPDFIANVTGALLVVDPFRRGAYVESEVVYGSNGASQHEPTYHVYERSFLAREADYLFQDPPSSIRTKSSGETRSVVQRITLEPRQIGGWLLGQRREKDAVDYLVRELERSAEDPVLFEQLRYAAGRARVEKQIDAWLVEHRSDEPRSLHFHRFYQDEGAQNGRHAELEREYAQLAARLPRAAFAQYLYGRVAPHDEAAMAAFRRALELDDGFAWPHLGLAHEHSVREEWAEAVQHARDFVRLRGDAARDHERLWEVLVNARRFRELEGDLAAGRGPLEEDRALQVHGQALVAEDASDDAWRTFLGSVRATASSLVPELELARARWRGSATEVRALLASRGGPEDEARRLQTVGVELGLGDRERAEQALEQVLASPTEDDAHVFVLLVLVGLAAEWSGDLDKARAFYERADEIAIDFHDHELCRFLERNASLAQLVREDRRRRPEVRALSRLAQALRASDAKDRDRLVDSALRIASWNLTETAFAIRGFFSREAPVRARRR